ncbi:hypothetical protein [Mycobacterium sp. TY813]|nr:hypothetical protein [Mycobacterium sp. TY813]MDP7729535.1 hypothetical protein [Mycobacterium sp. TY813]
MSDDRAIEAFEIDLDVAACGEILTAHGVTPTAPLVTALWEWKQDNTNE